MILNVYIYIMYHHVLSICCLTYCIDSFIQLAAQNRLSRRDFSRKTHPPWDDPHGMLAGVVPIKINMGGHPPIKKKTPFWIFCFCWESRVLMFLTWWFWCWLRMIQMVQERICIAQSQWRRCFVVMTIYIYRCIEEIQGTESPKSRTMIEKNVHFFLLLSY